MERAATSRPSREAEDPESSAAGSTLSFDPRTVAAEDVLRATYWLDDLATFEVSTSSADAILVRIFPRASVTAGDRQAIVEALRSRVIDEHVRATVREETRTVRELILAKAFAVAGLLDDPPPGDDRDPVEAGTARKSRTST